MSISLDIMYSRPGIYVITVPLGTHFVEIDDQHECHQLKFPSFERDGILKRGHWHPEVITAIAGPLFRASSRVA